MEGVIDITLALEAQSSVRQEFGEDVVAKSPPLRYVPCSVALITHSIHDPAN